MIFRPFLRSVVPVSVRSTTTSIRSGTFASEAPYEGKSRTGIPSLPKILRRDFRVLGRDPAVRPDPAHVVDRFVAVDGHDDLHVPLAGLAVGEGRPPSPPPPSPAPSRGRRCRGRSSPSPRRSGSPAAGGSSPSRSARHRCTGYSPGPSAFTSRSASLKSWRVWASRLPFGSAMVIIIPLHIQEKRMGEKGGWSGNGMDHEPGEQFRLKPRGFRGHDPPGICDGENHVFTLTGCIEKATANSPRSTSASRSRSGRAPPRYWSRGSPRGSVIPRIPVSTRSWRTDTSRESIGDRHGSTGVEHSYQIPSRYMCRTWNCEAGRTCGGRWKADVSTSPYARTEKDSPIFCRKPWGVYAEIGNETAVPVDPDPVMREKHPHEAARLVRIPALSWFPQFRHIHGRFGPVVPVSDIYGRDTGKSRPQPARACTGRRRQRPHERHRRHRIPGYRVGNPPAPHRPDRQGQLPGTGGRQVRCAHRRYRYGMSGRSPCRTGSVHCRRIRLSW